jgi:hypothetical protein
MASDPAPSGRSPRTRGRRVALAVWAGLGTFVVLLLLDGLWAGRSLVRGLTDARSELAIGIESIVTGDPDAAAPHFDAAREAAQDALDAVGHPSMGIAGLFPIAGANIDAAAAVADASLATADAGTTMVGVARDLGWSDIRIPASTSIGSLDLEAFTTALPRMGQVTRRLSDALRSLEAVDGGGLLGPVANGYRDAVSGLERRTEVAKRFRDAMQLVTTMFAGEHRYLVNVPALGVPKAGGGIPTTVAVLDVRDGRMLVEDVMPAPDAVADVDVSIDWPRTARALIAAAEEDGITGIDGAIQLDAVALQDLVWVIGDVEVTGRRFPLSDRSTTTALEIDAFLGESPAGAAALHADWVASILLAMIDRHPGVESFALATSADARDRHLAIYLPTPEGRRLLRSLGIEGRAHVGIPRFLPIVTTWAALGADHVGALVETTVRQTVSIRRDGSARVATQVLFRNHAGTDPPSVLLGRRIGRVPVGTFSAEVTLYVPRRATNVVAETSRPSPIRIGQDLGLATVTGSVTVRAEASTTLTATYRVEDAVRIVDGVRQVDLRLVPQPTVEGVRFQIRVTLPEGSTILEASSPFERRGDSATFSRIQGGPVDLRIRFAPGT